MSELSHLGRSGNPGKRDNFSSYERFGSPNRDNSLPGEGHIMLKFRIESRNSYQRSENLLGKIHCDRMTEENSKKEGYLYI